jgi:tetratricopeptide (TPR) repeat protein
MGLIVVAASLMLGGIDAYGSGQTGIGGGQAETRIVEFQFFLPGGERSTRQVEMAVRCPGGTVMVVKSSPLGVARLALPAEGEPLCEMAVEGQRNRFDGLTGRVRISRGLDLYPVFLPLVAGAGEEKKGSAPSSEKEPPVEARQWVESAQRKQEAGQIGPAISDLARALRVSPRYAVALNQLGLLYFRENRFGEAVMAFTQGVGLGGVGSAIPLNLGVTLQRLGRHAEAVRVLTELVEKDRSMARARIPLADSLMQVQQWDAAVEVLQAALETSLGPELEAEARYRLAQTMVREERYRSAVRELDRALALLPGWTGTPLAQLQLGKAHLSLGNDELAEAALRQALEKGGFAVVEGRLLLTRLFLRQKKFDAAEKMLELYSQEAGRATSQTEVTDLLRQIRAGRP